MYKLLGDLNKIRIQDLIIENILSLYLYTIYVCVIPYYFILLT